MRSLASRGSLLVASVLACSFAGCSQASFSDVGTPGDGGASDGAKVAHDATQPGHDAAHSGGDSGDASHADDAAKDAGVDAAKAEDAAKDTGVDAPTPDEAACVKRAAAECALRSTCTNGFNVTLNYGSLPACEARATATCLASFVAPGTSQSRTGVLNCAAAYPNETCVSYFDDDPVASCVPAPGSVATGGACAFDAQCVTAFCASGANVVCGKCAPLPAVGDACQIESDCGRDLACAIPAGASTGKCAAFALPGGPCLTGVSPCQSGYACVGDDVATSTTGACMLSGATVGAVCDAARKTAPNCSAPDGFVCVPTSVASTVGQCKAITLVGAGMPCGNIGAAPITGFADCTASGLCAGTSTGVHMCVAAVADGAACNSDPAVGPPCLEPSKCVPTADGGTAGICTPISAATCM